MAILEKLEECPKCGESGQRWLYDSQICNTCKSALQAVKKWPVRSKALRRELVNQYEACPECGGELDTGFECNKCGYDAAKLVVSATGRI